VVITFTQSFHPTCQFYFAAMDERRDNLYTLIFPGWSDSSKHYDPRAAWNRKKYKDSTPPLPGANNQTK
jgi:hypothetical protein